MAQRRMLSKRIVTSAKFIRMPVSSRDLYFYLVLEADDDGIVEAFSVMRLIGASDDDLRILVAKGFVIMLNDDLVAYITDWTENNHIRADRKTDSIYQKLLLSVVPNAKIVKPKQRADVKKKLPDKNSKQLPSRQPVDVQRTAQDRVGKDSVVQDSLGEVSSGQDSVVQDNPVDVDGVADHESNNQEASSPTKTATKSVYDIYQENFGLVSPFIIDTIRQDVEEYGQDLVIEAMKRAKLNQAKYVYAQGILSKWHDAGVKTLDDVKAADVEYANQKKYSRSRKIVQKETLPEWAKDMTSSQPKSPEPEISQQDLNEKLRRLRENLPEANEHN